MGLHRFAVWLSISVAILGVTDTGWLVAMADLLADNHLPERLCHPRFLQQLESLRPLRLLGPLKPQHTVFLLSRACRPGALNHHTGETT